jgi:hypothetical protein
VTDALTFPAGTSVSGMAATKDDGTFNQSHANAHDGTIQRVGIPSCHSRVHEKHRTGETAMHLPPIFVEFTL